MEINDSVATLNKCSKKLQLHEWLDKKTGKAKEDKAMNGKVIFPGGYYFRYLLTNIWPSGN